jgi:hypothetical protein
MEVYVLNGSVSFERFRMKEFHPADFIQIVHRILTRHQLLLLSWRQMADCLSVLIAKKKTQTEELKRRPRPAIESAVSRF